MKSAVRALPLIALLSWLPGCGIYSPTNAQPIVIYVNYSNLPAGPVGSTVALNGAEFLNDQGSGQVVFINTVTFASKAAVVQPGDWTDQTIVTSVPDGLSPGAYLISVITGNGITSNQKPFTVLPAVFTPSGLAWTAQSSLPSPQSGTSVAFVQVNGTNYVYAVGGARAGGAPTANVYYATVSVGGTIGTWTATTSLPTALAFTAATAATQYNTTISTNGYLYAVGGATDAAGTPSTALYRAAINGDGTLGTWTTAGVTQLPAPLRSVGAIVHQGSLYVVGGAGAGNVPVATVYRAPIQVTGNLNSLDLQAGSLPAPRARFGFGASGLYLYVFGGDGSAVGPNDGTVGGQQTATIYYARLVNTTHNVIGWTTSSTPLPAARSALSAVLYSNSVLLTGGLYSGGGAEEIYAGLNNGNGSVGAFTTSGGTIGRNIFNQGATGYLDGNGAFHVLVAGGDDADAAGTRRAESFRY